MSMVQIIISWYKKIRQAVHPPSGNRRERRISMNIQNAESSYAKKYFVFFETDEEGIRQFQSCPDHDRPGAVLSKMYIEGRIVPALKLEVDKNAYEIFKREQWMQEASIQNRKPLHHQRKERKSKILSHQNPKPHIHSGQQPAQNTCQQLLCLSA